MKYKHLKKCCNMLTETKSSRIINLHFDDRFLCGHLAMKKAIIRFFVTLEQEEENEIRCVFVKEFKDWGFLPCIRCTAIKLGSKKHKLLLKTVSELKRKAKEGE